MRFCLLFVVLLLSATIFAEECSDHKTCGVGSSCCCSNSGHLYCTCCASSERCCPYSGMAACCPSSMQCTTRGCRGFSSLRSN